MSIASAQRIDELIDFAIGNATAGLNAADERRSGRRYAYEALAAAVWLNDENMKSAPTVIHCQDISVGGLRVWSMTPLRIGWLGAVQIVRPTGKVAIVGASVQHCRELSPERHEAGLSFCALPDGLSAQDFLDSARGLPLFHTALRANVRMM